jgi:hypothetical protein
MDDDAPLLPYQPHPDDDATTDTDTDARCRRAPLPPPPPPPLECALVCAEEPSHNWYKLPCCGAHLCYTCVHRWRAAGERVGGVYGHLRINTRCPRCVKPLDLHALQRVKAPKPLAPRR